MSIQYCDYCDKHIDTDFEVEHFNEDGVCLEQEDQEVVDDIADMDWADSCQWFNE